LLLYCIQGTKKSISLAAAVAMAAKSANQKLHVNDTSPPVAKAKSSLDISTHESSLSSLSGYRSKSSSPSDDNATDNEDEVTNTFTLSDIKASIEDGWKVFNPRDEFSRVGLLNPAEKDPTPCAWRLVDNSRYEHFSTYPSHFIIPAIFSDEDILAVGKFRSRERVPAVTWKHPSNQAVLARSSQPRSGAFGRRCEQDERLLDICRESHCDSQSKRASQCFSSQNPLANGMNNDTESTPEKEKTLHVFDARGWLAIKGNEAQGKGVEVPANYKKTVLHFCDIGLVFLSCLVSFLL
jgi:hypothetical protein